MTGSTKLTFLLFLVFITACKTSQSPQTEENEQGETNLPPQFEGGISLLNSESLLYVDQRIRDINEFITVSCPTASDPNAHTITGLDIQATLSVNGGAHETIALDEEHRAVVNISSRGGSSLEVVCTVTDPGGLTDDVSLALSIDQDDAPELNTTELGDFDGLKNHACNWQVAESCGVMPALTMPQLSDPDGDELIGYDIYLNGELIERHTGTEYTAVAQQVTGPGVYMFQAIGVTNSPNQDSQYSNMSESYRLEVFDGEQNYSACQSAPTLTPDLVKKPFSTESFWYRPIADTAQYLDVSDAIFGDPQQEPTHFDLDIVSVCYVDTTQPYVRIEQNTGWEFPDRATSTVDVQYSRQLSSQACTGLAWNKEGNGLFVIIDPVTGEADSGVGGWRCEDEPILNFNADSPTSHNLDIINGTGDEFVAGRASQLSALGGLIRQGELTTGIDHAIAINMPSVRFYSGEYFQWPANDADAYANNETYGYLGDDPNYTMGTLLAIPRPIDINNLGLATLQGRNIAQAAQIYGMYIVDSSGVGGLIPGNVATMHLGVEVRAALEDFGLSIDPETNEKQYDSAKIDIGGLASDLQIILGQLHAVQNP